MSRKGAISDVILDGVVTPFTLVIVFSFFFFVFQVTGYGTDEITRSGIIDGNIDHGLYPEMLLNSYLSSPLLSCSVDSEGKIPSHMTYQDLIRILVLQGDILLPDSFVIEEEVFSYSHYWYECTIEYFSQSLGGKTSDFSSHPFPWGIEVYKGSSIAIDVSDASAETPLAEQTIYGTYSEPLKVVLTQQGLLEQQVKVLT